MKSDPKERLEVLRILLGQGGLSTQEELREKLEKLDFVVTQSTISRDLRKLGAIRVTNAEGSTAYRLPEELEPSVSASLSGLIKDILTNGSVIIIHTAVGSASLIARHLDRLRPGGLLDTAPARR